MSEATEISLPAELVRKGIHLFALVIPVGHYLVSFPVAVVGITVPAAVAVLIDLSRFRQWRLWDAVSPFLGPIIRDHEVKGGFTGASYILSASAFVIIVYPKAVAIAAITFIIIGDIAAALVGRMWGRHRLIGRKSVEGSLACLVSLILVSFLIPGLPTIVGLVGAVVATLAEAYSGKIDDNLAVPVLSGAAMLVIMHWMGYQGAMLFEGFR